MTDRHTADTITSDALDQLYARAERAEAEVAGVQQLLDVGPIGSCCAHLVRAALGRTEQPETQAAPPPTVGYSGKGRVWCVKCPHPDDENAPVTTDEVDEWDLCPSCGRHVIDVAREEA